MNGKKKVTRYKRRAARGNPKYKAGVVKAGDHFVVGAGITKTGRRKKTTVVTRPKKFNKNQLSELGTHFYEKDNSKGTKQRRKESKRSLRGKLLMKTKKKKFKDY